MWKYRFSLFSLGLALNSHANETEQAREADKLLQATAVRDMIKLSIPQVSPACIDKSWHKRAVELNQAYQQEYSLAELQTLNAFFQTQAARHYVLEMANQIRLNKALPVMQPANYSELDKQHVQVFFETPTGKKFSSGTAAKRINDVGMQVGMAISLDCFKK